MQKFARAVIGTSNVDNCSRYRQSPATMGLFRTVGYGVIRARYRILPARLLFSLSAAIRRRVIQFWQDELNGLTSYTVKD